MKNGKNDRPLTGKVIVTLLLVASTLVGALLFFTIKAVLPAAGLTLTLVLSGMGASLFLGLACTALLALQRRPAAQMMSDE
ncbi:MAG: hypothetical protein AB1791_18495 [Chloroflexota bacterium]